MSPMLLQMVKDRLAALSKPLDDDPEIAGAFCDAIEEYVDARIRSIVEARAILPERK